MSIPHKALEFFHEGWREHSKTGFHVTFLVSPDDSDFFRSLKDGQRLQAVLVCLADDDQPAPLPTPADKDRQDAKRLKAALADAGAQPPAVVVDQATFDKTIADAFPDKKPAAILMDNGGSVSHKFPDGLCGLAVMWCGDEGFHDWLGGTYPEEWAKNPDAPADERAKGVICRMCGVTTRKDLDTFKEAEVLFHQQFRVPYRAHLENIGVDPF